MKNGIPDALFFTSLSRQFEQLYELPLVIACTRRRNSQVRRPSTM